MKVVVPEEPLTTSPGEEASCEARICNTGTVADEFILQVFGEPTQWSVIEPARVKLEPAGEAAVTAPPSAHERRPRKRVASRLGSVRLRQHDPGVFAVKQRVLELVPGAAAAEPVPTPGISMKVTPSDVVCDAGGTAAVQVRVQNTGTVIDDLVVEVLGDAGLGHS